MTASRTEGRSLPLAIQHRPRAMLAKTGPHVSIGRAAVGYSEILTAQARVRDNSSVTRRAQPLRHDWLGVSRPDRK